MRTDTFDALCLKFDPSQRDLSCAIIAIGYKQDPRKFANYQFTK